MNATKVHKKRALHRQNLVFLLAITAILGMIYVWEELPTRRKYTQAQTRAQLIDLAWEKKAVEVITPKVHLLQTPNGWKFKNHALPVSSEFLQGWAQKLKDLKIKSVVAQGLPGQWPLPPESYLGKDPLKLSFVWANGSQSDFILGQKIKYGREFYIQTADQLVLVEDSALDKELYREEEYHNSEIKYLRVQAVFLTPLEGFVDNRVFPPGTLTLRKVRARSFRNPSFELDLSGLKTMPRAPQGVKLRKEAMTHFAQDISELKAIEVFPAANPQKLKEEMGSLELEDSKGQKKSLTLFRSYGKLRGPFLWSQSFPYLYKMGPVQTRLFLSQATDFWERRLNPAGAKHMALDFGGGHKKVDLVPGHEGPKAKKEALERLYALLEREAERLSPQNREDTLEFNKASLKIFLDGEEYLLSQNAHGVLAFNPAKKLVWEFLSTGEAILPGQKYEDYFR